MSYAETIVNPDVIRNTVIGVVAIVGLIILIMDLYLKWKKVQEEKGKPKEKETNALVDKISKGVLEQLEPRLKEFDKKLAKHEEHLANDKQRLDSQEASINSLRKDFERDHEMNIAVCKGMLALMDKLCDDKDTDVQAAKKELRDAVLSSKI